MIPFASQRGGGQDLATHLMNEHDNEYMELFEVRGAVARDLHGAFAEWEAQAKALTRCRQYLCSLSINPHELQGRLTRDQYLDYIDRAEEKLGLTGQPRAVIFHIKEDERGRMREHCHVVWSRIDPEAGKAVPLSFFKEKMMTVTREFARDHGLELPQGYYRMEEGLRRRNRQLTGYDCIKQKETGISHEDRMAAVTDAWRRSDNGRAFVNALADLGYVLARGRNGTRIVLVDFYGHSTALTRLIDDPSVRAKQVRDFLGPDYAPENLPSVEDAQALVAEHRKAIETFEKARVEGEQAARLLRQQVERRKALEAEAARLRKVQHQERAALSADQRAAQQALKSAYLAEQRHVRSQRAQHRPTGLAAFLGRVTGVALVIQKVQRYRDRRRFEAYLAQRDELRRRQAQERQALARCQELQAADINRKLRALDQVEKRERQGLEQARTKERRQRANARHAHMPALTLELKPRGRKAVPHKAVQRHTSPLAQELARVAEDGRPDERRRGLRDAFARASGSGEREEGSGEGDSGLPDTGGARIGDRDDRGGLGDAFERAVEKQHRETEGGRSDAEALRPTADHKVRRRRRRKERPERKAEEKDRNDQERKPKRTRRRRRDLDRGM